MHGLRMEIRWEDLSTYSAGISFEMASKIQITCSPASACPYSTSAAQPSLYKSGQPRDSECRALSNEYLLRFKMKWKRFQVLETSSPAQYSVTNWCRQQETQFFLTPVTHFSGCRWSMTQLTKAGMWRRAWTTPLR